MGKLELIEKKSFSYVTLKLIESVEISHAPADFFCFVNQCNQFYLIKPKFYSQRHTESGIEKKYWRERRHCSSGSNVFQALNSMGNLGKHDGLLARKIFRILDDLF